MFHGQAKWTVFHPRDAVRVEQYLQGCSEPPTEYPQLFLGQHFLKEFELDKIYEKFSIKPSIFTQNAGQAIIIPAGCPHQVVSQSDNSGFSENKGFRS
jgi:hypothetical protein